MKFHMGLAAAGAATLIAGTSMGASLSDIVIKGPMAERIHENAEISVSVAEKLAKHCIDEAASKNMSVSVAVLDQYGTLTYYYRADGQPKGRILRTSWHFQPREDNVTVSGRKLHVTRVATCTESAASTHSSSSKTRSATVWKLIAISGSSLDRW